MQNTAGMALMLAIIAAGVSVWIALGQTFLAPAPSARAMTVTPTAEAATTTPPGATWRKNGIQPTATVAATPVPASPPAEPSPTATPLVASPTPAPPTPTPEPTFTPSAPATPTVAASGRAPWILLPSPPPGGRVAAGPGVVEARGRGEAPITAIQLELDGVALPVTMEQRSESIWRGWAAVSVPAGSHEVRASVTDANGRTGSYRWRFEATR